MDRAEVKVLPPFIFLAFLSLGVSAGLSSSARMAAPETATTMGVILIVASVTIVGLAFDALARAETPIDVRRPTATLVTTGIFSATRNPIYLSMTLLHIGVAFFVNSPWTFLLAAPMTSTLCLIAIKPEERYLERKFGDAYRAYRARTPRWL
ncbi:MAG TPA: isoprenylcysteine carboxylmethyltransferase family protein [Methylosinus sp.]|jgi:protein-S-isoprenylcysteine O-methyltransferase Ste14